jgi:hypothetical protein
MWMTANVGMDGHWKAKVVIAFVKVVKMIPPKIFDHTGMDPAVAILHVLNEHLIET